MIIESYLIEYLNRVLEVPVYAEIPPVEPPKYVIVQKVGRAENNSLYTDSVAFKSVSDSLLDSAILDDLVQNMVRDLVAYDEISGVHLASNYENSDVTKKKYRYQCIFDITHK